jgi:hypothetical protein
LDFVKEGNSPPGCGSIVVLCEQMSVADDEPTAGSNVARCIRGYQQFQLAVLAVLRDKESGNG